MISKQILHFHHLVVRIELVNAQNVRFNTAFREFPLSRKAWGCWESTNEFVGKIINYSFNLI